MAEGCDRKENFVFFFFTGYLKRVIVTPVVSKPGFGSEPVRVSFSPPSPRGGGVERPRARFRPPGRNDGSNYDSLKVSKRPKLFPLDDAIPAFVHRMAPNPNHSLYCGFVALRWANAVIASSKGNNLGVLLTRYLLLLWYF